jgi:hypothetical protein
MWLSTFERPGTAWELPRSANQTFPFPSVALSGLMDTDQVLAIIYLDSSVVNVVKGRSAGRSIYES